MRQRREDNINRLLLETRDDEDRGCGLSLLCRIGLTLLFLGGLTIMFISCLWIRAHVKIMPENFSCVVSREGILTGNET